MPIKITLLFGILILGFGTAIGATFEIGPNGDLIAKDKSAKASLADSSRLGEQHSVLILNPSTDCASLVIALQSLAAKGDISETLVFGKKQVTYKFPLSNGFKSAPWNAVYLSHLLHRETLVSGSVLTDPGHPGVAVYVLDLNRVSKTQLPLRLRQLKKKWKSLAVALETAKSDKASSAFDVFEIAAKSKAHFFAAEKSS